MNINKMELVFLLDRSGSMSGLESDTIGGFNSMLAQQRGKVGDVDITTVLFDGEYELLHDSVSIDKIKDITSEEYYVRGNTALMDAFGKTINNIGSKLAKLNENDRPGSVMFVIITDGMENASREFSAAQIRSMVEHQKSKYNWEFLFLGANIDAVEVAENYGIAANRAVTYQADSIGTKINFKAVAKQVSQMREQECMNEDWACEVAEYCSQSNEIPDTGGEHNATHVELRSQSCANILSSPSDTVLKAKARGKGSKA